MPNPNIKDYAVKFGSGQDPRKGGRKKKIYTILKEKGYSGDDIRTAFGELAWYTLKELEEVNEDEKKPLIMRTISNQMILAFKKGDWTKIKEIIEHTIGKPTQPLANDKESPLMLKSIPIVLSKDRSISDVIKDIDKEIKKNE